LFTGKIENPRIIHPELPSVNFTRLPSLKEEATMEDKIITIYHLVKNEDLNHHGTLYAGRTAEWFVEAGFLAAAILTHPANTVCLQIHGMTFTRPVHRGDITCFSSKVVFTGKSRLVTYIQMKANVQAVVEGFITFIHVDEQGKPKPHGITITPQTPEDLELYERAKNLPAAGQW
jgi:acyl-CoA hydrolase